jgi:hypothetical protein
MSNFAKIRSGPLAGAAYFSPLFSNCAVQCRMRAHTIYFNRFNNWKLIIDKASTPPPLAKTAT